MSGIATAIVGTAVVGGIMSSRAGDKAAKASEAAAATQAGYEKEALEYLKEKEALPRALSEEALTKLGGMYGLEAGEGSEQEMIDRALASPLYGAIMGGREAGEEAILRSAAATGGLRSGNVQEALYDYNTQLQNKALLESYNRQVQGLQGMAGLPSLAPTIAQQTSQIGQTYSQGQVAAAQARQSGTQQGIDAAMGIGGLGIQAYGAGMFSDRRLKTNIKLIGTEKGFNLYSWDWNIVARKMGLDGKTVGVMADEVYSKMKEAVSIKDCFMWVDYSKIGILPGGA